MAPLVRLWVSALSEVINAQAGSRKLIRSCSSQGFGGGVFLGTTCR
jgi:hypothetical protein